MSFNKILLLTIDLLLPFVTFSLVVVAGLAFVLKLVLLQLNNIDISLMKYARKMQTRI